MFDFFFHEGEHLSIIYPDTTVARRSSIQSCGTPCAQTPLADTYHYCVGESFLLCVSPPCGAEAGRQTGAPCFLCSSPLLLLLVGRWWCFTWEFYCIRTSLQRPFFGLALTFSLRRLSASTPLHLRSRLWAHRWSGGITTRGRRRRGVEKGGEGWRCRTQGGGSQTRSAEPKEVI